MKTAWVRAQLAQDSLTSAREIDRQKKQLAAEKARLKREAQAAKRASRANKASRSKGSRKR